ncbi:MAG: hypothetical protein JW783_00415 [Bacteroidales bacterium]|nr:hypothetical protein [Bacteroidales bacterium]MBN2748484.1 hypothetical protein [Bacteroidales bacterium]
MKKTLKLVLLTFAVAVIAAYGCDTQTRNNGKTEQNWTYMEDKDPMDGTARHFANNTSINKIDFEFPYNGGSSFKLTLREMGYGNEVLIRVSSGQFLTDALNGVTIRAKFDENQPINYTYQTPSDGSLDMIFIDEAESFIENLKTAKKLKIEAQFYNEGSKIIEFDVDGLTWNK